MAEEKAPLRIRSFGDANSWLENSFRFGNKERRANHVLLREGIVLSWAPIRDASYETGQWLILNDKKETLAKGTTFFRDAMSVDEWNDAAMELWRACLAWGPNTNSGVEYIYFTTFVDDDGQQEDDTRNIGRAPMPHDDASRKGMPTAKDWELVSTNIAPVRGRDDVLAGPKRERARIYYHWRRAVR